MTDAADPDRDDGPSPTIALLTLARAAELRMARVLEPHGLTLRKYGLLQRISTGHGISRSELARVAVIDPAGMPALLRPMIESGLVRAAKGAAGHAELLTVTPDGTRLLARLDRDIRSVDAELFAGEKLADLAAALAAAVAEPVRVPQD